MEDRVRKLNEAPFREGADYVLYWAQMNRRTAMNQALSYAVALANERRLPVLFYEGLTCTYPHANDRLHTFLLEGVPDTARALKKLGIGYCFYLRRRRGDPDDVLYQLAAKAAAVVTDDYPTFIARRHNARVPPKLEIPYFVVDASCIVPMSRIESRQYAAYTIRPRIRKLLPDYLKPMPEIRVHKKYTAAPSRFNTEVTTKGIPELVASCEIDHSVAPSTAFGGGWGEARKRLDLFLRERLAIYGAGRNHPSEHATSNLSPYLHFGHLSSLEAALAVSGHSGPDSASADAFLEELIVRRELAFNFARFTDDRETLDNVPAWARETLRKHSGDPRVPQYSLEQMESAETYDDLWNATQRELLLRGKIHGYYRMYWGKKMMQWSRTPEEALHAMIYLHDRYALDGRDPNTYTNILWCFGLHDRAWPERPIFGKTRYLSYEGMKRKTDTGAYLREIAELERTGRDVYHL